MRRSLLSVLLLPLITARVRTAGLTAETTQQVGGNVLCALVDAVSGVPNRIELMGGILLGQKGDPLGPAND